MRKLSFLIKPLEDHGPEVLTVTPAIDGVSLSEMVEQFERERGFEPAGGYGGLVPDWFRYGPLVLYFLGHPNAEYFSQGRPCYLLGCSCGEVGCWPLSARITASEEAVIWDHFEQEHRRERDYAAFGPFMFDLNQYRRSVEEMAANFQPHR